MEEIGVKLGGNILRRYKVIMDYPSDRVILEPNKPFHEPFAADASGLGRWVTINRQFTPGLSA